RDGLKSSQSSSPETTNWLGEGPDLLPVERAALAAERGVELRLDVVGTGRACVGARLEGDVDRVDPVPELHGHLVLARAGSDLVLGSGSRAEALVVERCAGRVHDRQVVNASVASDAAVEGEHDLGE